MYYILKFNLRKGEGHFPSKNEVLAALPDADYEQLIRTSLRFSFNNDNGLLPVVDWKLVDDGLADFSMDESGGVVGYPNPVVWLQLEDEVDVDDDDAWVDALSSDYVLTIPGVNDNTPFYFQDHNGYSKVESAEWLADDLWNALQEIVQVMDDGELKEQGNGVKFIREKETNNDGIVLSVRIKTADQHCTFSWYFETEDALNEFDYHDNGYSDSDDQPFAENNSMVYKLHAVFCQINN